MAYNYEKPHSRLGKRSPAEFEEYLKELDLEKREPLIIYTYSQIDDNLSKLQLELDL